MSAFHVPNQSLLREAEITIVTTMMLLLPQSYTEGLICPGEASGSCENMDLCETVACVAPNLSSLVLSSCDLACLESDENCMLFRNCKNFPRDADASA